MTSSLSALEQLLALSEEMLSAAAAGDWETLTEREAARRALAHSLPATLTSDLSRASEERARLVIEACLRCDLRVRPLVEARLNELRVVLRTERPTA